mmetsp:Transcript_22102/g.36607  ORF Transcript_22102/g.36607 Transcript_22102/m.36607 type:complete len:223 (+) Transcript_22102:1021-1689(+)
MGPFDALVCLCMIKSHFESGKEMGLRWGLYRRENETTWSFRTPFWQTWTKTGRLPKAVSQDHGTDDTTALSFQTMNGQSWTFQQRDDMNSTEAGIKIDLRQREVSQSRENGDTTVSYQKPVCRSGQTGLQHEVSLCHVTWSCRKSIGRTDICLRKEVCCHNHGKDDTLLSLRKLAGQRGTAKMGRQTEISRVRVHGIRSDTIGLPQSRAGQTQEKIDLRSEL